MANGKVLHPDKGMLPAWHKDYVKPKAIKPGPKKTNTELMREKVAEEAIKQSIPASDRTKWIAETVRLRMDQMKVSKKAYKLKLSEHQQKEKTKIAARKKAKRNAKKKAQATQAKK